MLFPVAKTSVKLGIVLIEALLSWDSLYPNNKKWHFPALPILNIFSRKFQGLMQRALMWLNLCGCQAVWRKLKKGVKTQKMHFYFFELKSDSLKTIYVEPHQCPSDQFILITKRPIPKIVLKKYWELPELKVSKFQKQIFLFSFEPKTNEIIFWFLP